MVESLARLGQSRIRCGSSHKKKASGPCSLFLSLSPSRWYIPFSLEELFLSSLPFLPLFFHFGEASPPTLPLPLDVSGSSFLFCLYLTLVNVWTPLRWSSCIANGFNSSINKRRALLSPRSEIWSITFEKSFTYSRASPIHIVWVFVACPKPHLSHI